MAQAPQELAPVDLDLDVLAPDTRSFVFRGVTYQVPGDIAVPTLVDAMKLRGRMLALEDLDDEGKRETMEELYELIMEIVKDANPDAGDLRLSITQMMYLLGLILSGELGVSAEEVLAAELGAHDQKPGTKEDADHPPTRRKTKKAAQKAA